MIESGLPSEYAYQNYLKFNPPVEFTIEIEEEAHKKILKEYGLEEKRIYNINGQDYVWTEEKFDSFCKELNDKGYHPTFIIYDLIDDKKEFTENVTIVGDPNKWK